MEWTCNEYGSKLEFICLTLIVFCLNDFLLCYQSLGLDILKPWCVDYFL